MFENSTFVLSCKSLDKKSVPQETIDGIKAALEGEALEYLEYKMKVLESHVASWQKKCDTISVCAMNKGLSTPCSHVSLYDGYPLLDLCCNTVH